MLFKELPVFKQKLNDAFAEENIIDLREHAHKLHGATSYCDVPKLKAAVMELERASKLSDTQVIRVKLDQVNLAIIDVLAENA